jgi:MFS family permease
VARFSDRIGKGVRGAPRDALVGDLVPPALRGAAYGLRQSLDTVGAFAGPLLAVLLMALFDNDFRLVFWLAVIPGGIAVSILVLGVEEPARTHAPADAPPPLRWAEARELGQVFWGVVAVGAVLTLARFSEAFLVLRVRDTGMPTALVPLAIVVMNLIYASSAYPVGALSDRIGRAALIAGGFGVLIASDIVLALASNVWIAVVGVALWGLHLGMTQGLLAALVADAAPARLRGTAFGIFHFVSGIALLLASLIAGVIWESVGAPATFLSGAAFTAIGLAGGMVVASRQRSRSPASSGR